jgi:uncharacterized caspase-like protein
METTRSALIVANYSFADPGLRRLRAPAEDAEALAEVLQDPAIGDFEVHTVLDRPAHEVDRAVEAFFNDRSPDDLLLMHFSGHGVKDENGDLYFAAADTDLSLLGATAVSADFVNRLMSRTRSRRVVLLLDCCYAGAFERGLAARGDTELHLGERLGGRGRAVITASTAMEYAFEGTELTETADSRPSVFTSAVVDALRSGEADTDQDGLIGLDELYDYVYDKVRSVTPSMTPSKWAFGFQGELYLARRSQPVTTPSPLPAELEEALASPFTGVRAAAVDELGRYAHGTHAGRALAARQALERLAADDSRSVASAAAVALADAPAVVSPRLPPPGEKPGPASQDPPPEQVPAAVRGTAAEGETAAERSPLATAAAASSGGAESSQVSAGAGETQADVDVREPEDQRHGRTSDAASGSGGGRVSNRQLTVLGGGVALLLLVGVLVWALVTRGGSGGPTILSQTTIVIPSQTETSKALVLVDTQGGSQKRLDQTQAPRNPTITPDRSSIVYLTGTDASPVPRIVNADGTDDRPFLTSRSNCSKANRPAWSPGGGQIIIICRDTATPTLMLLNADRGFVSTVPTGKGLPIGAPTWIEVGHKSEVVFIRTKELGGPTQLWAVDPNAADPVSTLQRLTSGPADSHPDGSSGKLLFLRDTSAETGHGTVVVDDHPTTAADEHDIGLSDVASPTWSPDGGSIAYLENGELWVSDGNGGGAHSLKVAGALGPPAWGTR